MVSYVDDTYVAAIRKRPAPILGLDAPSDILQKGDRHGDRLAVCDVL
jgi:hypothetical protein